MTKSGYLVAYRTDTEYTLDNIELVYVCVRHVSEILRKYPIRDVNPIRET